MEIWKDIRGFEGIYQVSNFGNVKRLSQSRWIEKNKNYGFWPEHILRNEIDKDGYSKIRLCAKGICKKYMIHRLMSESFIDNNKNKTQVNHKNGIKGDNRIENLEWVTSSENRKHSYKIGLESKKGELNNMAKLKISDINLIRLLYKNGWLQREIAKSFDISRSHVSTIVNRISWNHIT